MMDDLKEQDISRLQELLHRTSEFIGYFELTETKMMEWRQDIDHQARAQFEQLQAIKNELNTFQQMLTQAGLKRFRAEAEHTLHQGKAYLLKIQKTEQQLIEQIKAHQQELTHMTQNATHLISQHSNQVIEKISHHLSHYDPQHIDRIVNDGCSKIEQSSLGALVKNKSLLKRVQWHSVALTVFTTMVTAFVISLYVSDEYPWETHRHAVNERGAGKVLISVWPKLNQQEKLRILGSLNSNQST
jgi:hypothetical protein